MTIATTGNLNLLLLSGSLNREALMQQWEAIVKANSKASGDYAYDSFFHLIKGYAQIIANYTIVKASLWKLSFMIDWETIKDLRKRGFKIDTSNTTKYTASLTAGLHKVNNLITRATMKRKEMEALQQKENASKGSKIIFEELIAHLSMSLGFEVKDTITLAAFNAYRSVLKRKSEMQQSHGRGNNK